MSATDDNLGARIRAARGYAKIDQGTLATRIGLGREVIIAMEMDKREPTVREMKRIARETGVPADFLLHGWGSISSNGDLADRVAALEARISSADEDREDLAARIDELSDALERRLETFAAQVLQRRRTKRRQEDPPAQVDPPAP